MLKKLLGKKHYIIESLNLNRHLNNLANKKVCVFSLKKIDEKTISFFAFAKDEKQINDEFKNAHLLKNENKSGIVFLLSLLKKNLLTFLSFVLCFIAFPILNAFVWKIDVYAFDADLKNSVQNYLADNKIKIGKIKAKYDVDLIRSNLLENFSSVANVDVQIKGETLIINVREKMYSENEFIRSTPIIAQFDGIVELVNIISGTAKVSKGQVVKAGDILVEAYVKRGNNFIPCEVVGEVNVRSFKLFESEFHEKSETFIRSGKKVTKNYFTILKDFDRINLEKSSFQNFETQVICLNEKVFPIVPIRLTSVCFYELIKKEKFLNFNENKNSILEEFKQEKLREAGAKEIYSEELQSEKKEDGIYKLTYYIDFLKTY